MTDNPNAKLDQAAIEALLATMAGDEPQQAAEMKAQEEPPEADPNVKLDQAAIEALLATMAGDEPQQAAEIKLQEEPTESDPNAKLDQAAIEALLASMGTEAGSDQLSEEASDEGDQGGLEALIASMGSEEPEKQRQENTNTEEQKSGSSVELLSKEHNIKKIFEPLLAIIFLIINCGYSVLNWLKRITGTHSFRVGKQNRFSVVRKAVLAFMVILMPALLVVAGASVLKKAAAITTTIEIQQPSPREQLAEQGLVFSEKQFISVAGQGNRAAVELFYAANMPINVTRDIDKYTALMAAAEFGKIEVVQVLLDQKADINVSDNIGQNAIMKAAAKGHDAVVKLLIECGADVNAVDSKGFNALRYAENKGYAGIAKLLYAAGAKRLPVPSLAGLQQQNASNQPKPTVQPPAATNSTRSTPANNSSADNPPQAAQTSQAIKAINDLPAGSSVSVHDFLNKFR